MYAAYSFIGTESNFDITNPSFVTTQSIPYDLGSIMHYSAFAFSNNRQATITPVDSNIPLSALGQRQGLSDMDLEHVTTLYCGGKFLGAALHAMKTFSMAPLSTLR